MRAARSRRLSGDGVITPTITWSTTEPCTPADLEFDRHRKVAARLQRDVWGAVHRKTWLEHFHFVLSRWQSLENKIALGVGGGHINGVDDIPFIIRHDAGGIRNGSITDIKD